MYSSSAYDNIPLMRLGEKQHENLGKYFFDLSKIVAGVYVFTSLPDSPLLFALGLSISIILLVCGLLLVKGEIS